MSVEHRTVHEGALLADLTMPFNPAGGTMTIPVGSPITLVAVIQVQEVRGLGFIRPDVVIEYHLQIVADQLTFRMPTTPDPGDEADEIACDWTDYRNEVGVSREHTTTEHKAFVAGWRAGRHGEQSGVLK